MSAAALLSQRPPASALTCDAVSYLIGPFKDAPVDTRVWVKLAANELETATLTLDPPIAAVVGWTDITLTGGHVIRSYELSGLEVGETTTVRLGGVFSYRNSAEFTVTEGPLGPAQIPTVVSTELTNSGEAVKISWTAAPSHIVLMAKAGDELLDEEGINGSVTAAMSSYPAQTFFLGATACSDRTWDTAQGETTFRVGAYHLNGEFSGWSAPHEASTGCGGGASPSSAAGIVAALGILLALRRRCSRAVEPVL